MEKDKLINFKVMTFTSKLLKRLHARDMKILLLPVKSISQADLFQLCDTFNSGQPDLNAVMVLSMKLAFKMQIFCGSWILAKFQAADVYQRKGHYRWIRIVVNPQLSSDKCFVSRLLLHNLKEKMASKDIKVVLRSEFIISNIYFVTRIFSILNSKVNIDNFISKYHSSLVPKFASKLEVAFVKGQCINVDFDEHLHLHFHIPQYLTNEDVFAVPLIPTEKLYSENVQCTFLPKYLLFKVVSITGTGPTTDFGYLVSREHTSLFLIGDRESKVPYMDLIVGTFGENVPPCLAETNSKLNEMFEFYQTSWDSFNEIEGLCLDNTEKVNDSTKESQAISNEKFNLDTNSNVLLIGPPGSGKTTLIKLLADKYSYHIHWLNCYSIKGDTSASTETKIRQAMSKVGPFCILVLSHIGCLSQDREGNPDPRVLGTLQTEFMRLSNVKPARPFIVGTAHDQGMLSDELWTMFTYQFTLSLPELEERNQTIKWLLIVYFKAIFGLIPEKINFIMPEEELKVYSHRTAGFNYGDLEELVSRVYRLYSIRASEDNFGNEDSNWLQEDLSKVLDEMQSQRSAALGLPRVPKVNWKDVGGLDQAKKELINTIQLPIKYPHLISSSLRRSGILLYGPPGTGKTLLAKSVASECGLNFLSVKGPELLNMYIGQSEENVRQVFEKAKSAAPCVIFFDELDSLAPNRGRSGDSGGVMDRIVSALLAELDGASSTSDVFVLAATNRPDLLDPALLRPGRFEKQIFLGLCETNEDQIKILRAVTSKIPLDKHVSLEKIAEQLPFTLTGADFSALAIDAFYIAMRRAICDIKRGHITEEEAKISVTEDDFHEASIKLVPSVSAAELASYKEMSKRH